LPQATILVLSVIAIGFGVNRMAFAEDPTVPAWVTGVVCLFALAYAVLAGLVIHEASKRARYKRPDFRFDVPFPIRIESGFGAATFGVVSSISTVGMECILPGSHPAPSSAEFTGVIYLPNGELPFEATLESRDRANGRGELAERMSVLFRWSNIAARDRLDQTLHACGWHRRYSPHREYLTTPIEWLQRKIAGGPPEPLVLDWKTILYRRIGDPEKRLNFGLCTKTNGGDGNVWLTAFRDLSMGDCIEVIDPRGEESPELMTVTACGLPPDRSAIELADVVPVVYAAMAGVQRSAPRVAAARP
jgi:hypothetical protein